MSLDFYTSSHKIMNVYGSNALLVLFWLAVLALSKYVILP
jgi:hypothetical protein